MNYKRYLIILLVAIVVFFILLFIYNKIINKNEGFYCYVSNKIIDEGEKIALEDLLKVKVNNILNKENILINLENLEGFVANRRIEFGKIIYIDDISKLDEYEKFKDLEYISLKVDSSDLGISYTISKNDIVNIYYTAKTEKVEDLISTFSDEDSYITGGMEDSYTTINILKNINVVDVFNNSGVSLNDTDNLSGDILIDTVMIRVSKDIAMQINNLKNYGKFSFTRVK